MKTKKRRIMTKKNWKKRWRQASKMKVEERAGYVSEQAPVIAAMSFEPPSAYTKQVKGVEEVSNF